MLRFARVIAVGALSLSTIALTPVVASAATHHDHHHASAFEYLLSNATYSVNSNGSYTIHFANGHAITVEPSGSIGAISYSTTTKSGHLYITFTFPDGRTITVDPPAVGS